MADTRITIESSFEKYFAQNILTNPHQRAVLEDKKRGILNQTEQIDGLWMIKMGFFYADEVSDLSHYFPNGFYQSVRQYFAAYDHQGSFADITHTYYFINCQ